MRPGVERNDAALLGEIERLFQEHNHETEFLNHCLDEAMEARKLREEASAGMSRSRLLWRKKAEQKQTNPVPGRV